MEITESLSKCRKVKPSQQGQWTFYVILTVRWRKECSGICVAHDNVVRKETKPCAFTVSIKIVFC